MNIRFKWLLLILLFAAPAFAQNARVDNVAFSSVQGFPFLPNATITVCTAVGAGVPCSPTVAGLCATSSDVVCSQPATFTSDALGNFGFWIQPGTYTYTVTKAGFGGFGPKPLTLACSPATSCFFNGIAQFSADTTVSGKLFLSGGNIQVDVTSPPFSAKCDGSTDDTAAFNSAISKINLQRTGGIVYIPPTATAACEVSTLNLDGMKNIYIVGYGQFGPIRTIEFTGTCASGACLSMRSTTDIVFRNVSLSFTNATTGPFVDLSHSALNTDTNRDMFHHVNFHGPGPTVGPMINNQQSDFITFDEWTTFDGASVFVTGPTNNAQFSDTTTFKNVLFYGPGTAAIQNASVNWTIEDSSLELCNPLNNYAAALQYTGGYTQMQGLLVKNSEITGGPGTGCNTTLSFWQLPNTSANVGNATFIGGLINGAASSNQTAFSIGNNNAVSISGAAYSNLTKLLAVGTGVSLNVGPNIYSSVTTFMTGTPASGSVLDNTGTVTNYGTTNIATGIAFNLICGAQPTLPVNDDSLWCSNSDNKLRVTKGGDTGGAASIVARAGDAVTWTAPQSFGSGNILPSAAGGTDLGSTALPFGNLWLGTAATNNFKFQPAATAAARTITMADPLQATVALPMTIANGTQALNTASVTTATCDGGVAATATGTLSTDKVSWSFNAAPTATNKYGAFLVVYAVPSTNTVTFYTCNPSATTSTPTAMSVNWSVERP